MSDFKHRRPGRLLAAGMVAAAIVALSACSSSESTHVSVAPSGTSAQQVAAARAVVAEWSKPPTKINVSEPLKNSPPRGKTVVYLRCEQAQCTDIGSGVQDAAQSVGWQVKTIPFQSSNPATLISAMNQALQYHPVSVIFTAVPQALWSSEEAKYQAAGVGLVPIFIGPATVSGPVIANIGAGSKTYGLLLANWLIADSGAAGSALLVSVPQFTILADVTRTFTSTVASGCSRCRVTDLNVTIDQLDAGQLNSLVVSALQRDPSIRYVIAADGAFVDTLPSSLAAAGLTTVKIAGSSADTINLSGLRSGQTSAFTGLALDYSGWLAIDATLRHAEGMTIQGGGSDGDLPTQLITKSSLTSVTGSYNEPADYQKQFAALWKLG